MKMRVFSAGLVVVFVGLSACGGDGEGSATAVTVPVTDGTAEAGAQFNEADVAFAQGMIPHHEQAVEMADVALDPEIGAGAEVVDLASRIKAGQGPEIELMTGWLTSWGQPVQMDTSQGHDMSSMDGMMSAEQMDSLGMMAGPQFDRMWMEMMIAHHTGAISMAQTVKAAGSNPDVVVLADQVIAAQQGEIAEMQALLDS